MTTTTTKSIRQLREDAHECQCAADDYNVMARTLANTFTIHSAYVTEEIQRLHRIRDEFARDAQTLLDQADAANIARYRAL